MRAVDFILETVSHFARDAQGPPPVVPSHADAEFETDLVSICQHQRLSTLVSEAFDQLALSPTMSRITVARIEHHAGILEEQRRHLLRLAGRLSAEFASRGIRSALLGDVRSAAEPGLLGEIRPVGRIDAMIDETQWMEAVGTLRELGFVRSRIQPRLADHSGAVAPLGAAVSANGSRAGKSGAVGVATSRKAAADALRYHQYFSPLVMHNHDGDTVELRFRVIDLGNPGRVNPAWERIVEIDFGGTIATAVCQEDQLIHSAVSFGAEGFADLLPVLDAGRLLSRHTDDLDWDYIAMRLLSRRLYPAFYFTLERICELLILRMPTANLEPPAAWRRRLFHMWWRPREADYTGETEPTAGRFAYSLVECGGVVSKALWLRRALFPRSAWVRSVYGRPANLWLRAKFLHDVRSGRRRRAADVSRAHGEVSGFNPLR
jgi:hypothetical protein